MATRDIKAGELLLLEKAYAIALPSSKPHSLVPRLDLETKRSPGGLGVNLGTQVIRRLLDNPADVERISSLYAGPASPSYPLPPPLSSSSLSSEEPIYPNIDAHRIENICKFNG